MKICEESVKKAIDTSLAHVQLDEAQKQAILAQCRPTVEVSRPRMRPVRRVLAVAAAFAMAFCLGGGVLAAAPQLRQSLTVLGTEALQQLQPVNQVSEDKGIRMEVLAAINDGEVASVFLSLQDTEGKGRVAPATWQYTSEISEMYFTHSKTVDYDPETQTLLLQLTADDSERLDNKKITVTTKAVLGEERYLDGVDTGYTLAELGEMLGTPKTHAGSEEYGFSLTGTRMEEMQQVMYDGKVPILEPWDEPMTFEQAPWVQMNAAGIVDGALHIQLKPDDELGLVNQPEFKLLDENGQIVGSTELVIDLAPQDQNDANRWTSPLMEYVLIPDEGADLSKLHLAVGGVFYKSITKGNWSTTFRLEPALESLEYVCHQNYEGVLYESVKISPIAVTVRGHENNSGETIGGEIEVYLKDGSRVESSASMVQMDSEGGVMIQETFDRVIDLEQVDKVLLNGEQIR